MPTRAESNLRIALVTVLAAAGSSIAFVVALTPGLFATESAPVLLLLGTLLASVVLFNAGRVIGSSPTTKPRGKLPVSLIRPVIPTPVLRAGEPLVSFSRAALESVVDAVIAIDTNLRIIMVNRGAELLLGYRREELLGRRCSQSLLAPINESGIPLCGSADCPARLVLPGGENAEGLVTLRRSDGARLTTAYRFRAVRDATQQVIGAIGVFRNVTEKRQFDRIRTDFLSVVSHELLTPLTSIRGATGLLQAWAEKEDREDEMELLQMCTRNAQQMERLIQEVLDLTGLETGRLPLKKAPANIGREVSGAVEEIRPFAEGREVELSLSVEPSIPLVNLDPQRFRQAMLCILRNGVQFSPDRGRLSVTVGLAPETVLDHESRRGAMEVEVSIADQGPGVPPEERRWIFERLTQVDATVRRQHTGLGLGLGMAKAIMEHHHGRIWVQDGPEGGADFRIRLPVLEERTTLSQEPEP